MLPSPKYLCIAMPVRIPASTSAACIIKRVGKFVFMFLPMLYPNVLWPLQKMNYPLLPLSGDKGNPSLV
jgi:hypothetical protein